MDKNNILWDNRATEYGLRLNKRTGDIHTEIIVSYAGNNNNDKAFIVEIENVPEGKRIDWYNASYKELVKKFEFSFCEKALLYSKEQEFLANKRVIELEEALDDLKEGLKDGITE